MGTLTVGGFRVISDPECRSTKEFRMEMVAVRRTWRERFVDGPVWAPKPEFKEPVLMPRGIPVAYELVGQRGQSQGSAVSRAGTTGRGICWTCHQPGHNATSCPNGEASRLCLSCLGHILDSYLRLGVICYQCRTKHKPLKGKYPRFKLCNHCGEKGHNVRTCQKARAA